MDSWALGIFMLEFASIWLVLSFKVKLYLKSCTTIIIVLADKTTVQAVNHLLDTQVRGLNLYC